MTTSSEFAGDDPSLDVIPEISRHKYEGAYKRFMDWKLKQKDGSFSELMLLQYMNELADRFKPSSLYTFYSMLKLQLKIKHNVDISTYHSLNALLKKQGDGYKPKKSMVFKPEEVNTFLDEAPNQKYLLVKVALIMGISGACRRTDLIKLKIGDIQDLQTRLLVTVKEKRTKTTKCFIVPSNYYNFIKEYLSLRPAQIETNRFFINFQKGKCTRQPVGINKFAAMPKQIAQYLHLPNPEHYTGYALRRSSSAILVESGADVLQLLKHDGGSKRSTVTEGHVVDSVHNKTGMSGSIGNTIGNSDTTSESTFIKSENDIYITSDTATIKSEIDMDSFTNTFEEPEPSDDSLSSFESITIENEDITFNETQQSSSTINIQSQLQSLNGPNRIFNFSNCNVTINVNKQ